MKTIIAGSRECVTIQDVIEATKKFEQEHGRITEVICGMARGADLLGKQWADSKGIPVDECPANWKPNGPDGPTDKAAGHKRNSYMAGRGEALIALWDGMSPGTNGMIQIAKRRGLIVLVHRVR